MSNATYPALDLGVFRVHSQAGSEPCLLTTTSPRRLLVPAPRRGSGTRVDEIGSVNRKSPASRRAHVTSATATVEVRRPTCSNEAAFYRWRRTHRDTATET